MQRWHPLKARKVSALHVPVSLSVALVPCFRVKISTLVSSFFFVFVFSFACHICVMSVLLSSLHPASYAFHSSIDVMEIVTKLGFLELHYSGPSARPQACSESHACGSSKDLYRGLFVVSSTRSSRWLAHLIHSTFEFLRGYPRLFCTLQPNCSLELFSNTHHGVWFLVFSSSRTAPCRWNWCGTRE